MTAYYLGGFTFAQAVPAFAQVATALASLRSAVSTQLSALATAKAAIRIPAVADFEAELEAALNVQASFSAQLGDPAAYLSGLLAGMAQVQLNLSALSPVIALNAQISASAAVAASLDVKIEAVDLQLNALVTIQAALTAAINAVVDALAFLNTGGARTFYYEGLLSQIGTELDGVTALTGLAPSASVRAVMILVDQADANANIALSGVMRVG